QYVTINSSSRILNSPTRYTRITAGSRDDRTTYSPIRGGIPERAMKRLLAVLLFLMAGSLTIPVCFAATPAQVSGAEITGNGTTADISLTMTAQPRFHIFYLANP